MNCCRQVQRVLNGGHPEPYRKARGAKLECCHGALRCRDVDGYAQPYTRKTKALYDVLARLLTASRRRASLHLSQAVVVSYVEASLSRWCSALGSSGMLFVCLGGGFVVRSAEALLQLTRSGISLQIS